MPGAHALLSASGAKRWIECPPSARFEAKLPEQPSSVDAETGTLAHAIAETRLGYVLGLTDKRAHDRKVKELRKSPLYGPVMDEHLDVYIDYVLKTVDQAKQRCPDPLIQLEMRLNLTRWVPDGFGTGDVVIVSDGLADIIDLKYGKGVPVDAQDNPQLRLYALGAYDELYLLYDIREVRMHIVQPRLESVTTETLALNELLAWAEDVVAPRAKLAYDGGGDFQSGDQCRWCRAKNICRRRALDLLELARGDFREPEQLTDDEIAGIIGQAEVLADWAKELKRYAQEQVLKHGKTYTGWKVVTGRSNRTILDEKAALERLVQGGYPTEQTCTLRGLGELEALVGKKKLPELLGELIVKPDGAPALVPETDKRPALNSAREDFKEEIH